MKRFSVIVAKSGQVIGNKGTIPWCYSRDLAFFKNMTEGNTIIMGRRTFESLPKKKPLPGRVNIVVTSSECPGVFTARSLDSALLFSSKEYPGREIFIIGGTRLYEEALNHTHCNNLYVTKIFQRYEGDTFFPKIDKTIFRTVSKSVVDKDLEFVTYRKHEEYQYLDIIDKVIKQGIDRGETLSLPGNMMRFNLSNDTLPLLTTKKVFSRGVIEELLWFIKGSTNCSSLNDKGVNIWKANGSRKFLDSRGLDYQENELGPVYGYQWRHFGKEYTGQGPSGLVDQGPVDQGPVDQELGPSGPVGPVDQGVDQLANVIRMIKEEPKSRRIILNSWNAVDIDKMALPPCHVMCQFLVNNGELTCLMYQRSCDLGLGIPFNIASYAILTHMIAKVTGTKAKEFIHFMADTHVYKEHIEPLKIQMKRYPKAFPRIVLNDVSSIDDFTIDDIKIIDYISHDTVKMKLVVQDEPEPARASSKEPEGTGSVRNRNRQGKQGP